MRIFANHKKIVATSSISAFLALGLALYTNATPLFKRLTVDEIVRHSRSLSVKLKSSQYSVGAKRKILEQKKIATNYLAAKIRARNCEELLRADTSMEPGVYGLYPRPDLVKPELVACDVTNGRLSAAVKLRDGVNQTTTCEAESCASSATLFVEIKCGGLLSAEYCLAENAFGTPIVVSSNGRCTNDNFGFDADKGLWVKNGCSGTFKMKRASGYLAQAIDEAAQIKNGLWVNKIGSESHVQACARLGLNVGRDDGFGICASGERRPNTGEGNLSISYLKGTWGTAYLGGQFVTGDYCYGADQKRDNDKTDLTMAYWCK